MTACPANFVHFLAQADKPLVHLAVALLWWHDHDKSGYEASTSELASELTALRLAGSVNRSRLKSDLQQHNATIAGSRTGLFRIALRAKAELDAMYLHVVEPTNRELSAPIPLRRARPKVFIGHGQSPLWRDLKDFLRDRLDLDWDEFNREPVAGVSTVGRLAEMLDQCDFAFLVMTGEDGHADGSTHARENVVHEVGLFQGRLGFKKAIVLLEEGCAEFSNIVGLAQIRFPKGNLLSRSEEIRRVLEREQVI